MDPVNATLGFMLGALVIGAILIIVAVARGL